MPEDDAEHKKLVENRIYAVREIVREVKLLLEGEYHDVQIEGEIRGLKRAASGHAYFALKDESAQINCALFKHYDRFLRFDPKEGQQVVARGHLSLYEGRGDFQLIVHSMRPAGEGELLKKFLALKEKLEYEGLFAEERKRPLPWLPRCVGVVTSPDGAVWHDIRQVLGRRFPDMPLVLAPCRVQGAGAAEEIADAIRLHNALGRVEVLIVGRGGGSLEDLWAFNEEAVVRAIVASRIPVISAVGHETDFTLADFAADRRAPTPSAAAEMCAPEQDALEEALDDARDRMSAALQRQARRLRERWAHLGLRLSHQPPWLPYAQRLDALSLGMERPMRIAMAGARQRHSKAAAALSVMDPRTMLAARAQQLLSAKAALEAAITARMNVTRRRLDLAAAQVRTLGPASTLERGYSIVQKTDGRIARDTADLATGEQVTLIFSKSRRNATAE